jgi:two-component system sensor histidine kinase HydH
LIIDGLKLQHFRDRAVRPLRELTLALLLVLSAATIGTLWLIYEVHKEQKAIGDLLRDHSPEMIDTLAPFPEELRWQFLLTVMLLGVLVASAVVLVLILRGYLNSQQSLRDLARQAADILESMEHGILTGDPGGRVITVNREAERILGITPGAAGLTLDAIDERLPGLDLARLGREILTGRKPSSERSFAYVRDGHRFHLLADGHLLRDEAGTVHGTVLHLSDVTERQLIRERMRRMEGYMGLGPVAAGLQHEIKNPLGALSLHVQLLAERLAASPDPEVREHLGVLKTEVSRIVGVLESFRDYANADVPSRSRVTPGEIVDRATRLIDPQARRQRARITVANHCDSDIELLADTNRLQQVLLNLLLNALEAMPAGGEIRVEIVPRDGHVEFAVADQGPGISPAAAAGLFDPYFTTKKNGLGMGLAVSRKIARLHEGELNFETSAAGAVFRLSLPAAPKHASV